MKNSNSRKMIADSAGELQLPLPEEVRPVARSLWMTGLLVLGSAALGGVAVALWNRGALASLRDAMQSPAEPQPGRDEDGIY